jgi:hypothetical protein
MKGKLETLHTIVFERQKVPYYNRRHGDLTIGTILDKEGLHTYIYNKKGIDSHKLVPWEELTEEDVMLLLEKLPEFPIKGALKP